MENESGSRRNTFPAEIGDLTKSNRGLAQEWWSRFWTTALVASEGS
jgi:hypothetical protein